MTSVLRSSCSIGWGMSCTSALPELVLIGASGCVAVNLSSCCLPDYQESFTACLEDLEDTIGEHEGRRHG